MKEASGSFGIKVQAPEYIEVPSDLARQPDGKGYLKPIEADISPKTLFALVLISDPKHKKVIKTLLDRKGIPSQFMLSATVDRAKITVYSNVLKQINAKVR